MVVPNLVLSSVLHIARKPGVARDLVTGGIGNIVLKVAQVLLAIALSAILARLLKPVGYGVYSYVFALVYVLLIPAQFGLTKLIIRETAKGQALDNYGLIRGIWNWSLSVGLGVTAVIVLILLGILFFLRGWLSEDVFYTCLAGVALLPLMVLVRFFGAALRGLRRVVLGQVPDILIRPGSLLILISIVAFGYGAQLTASRAMKLHVIAAAISLIVATLLLFLYRPRGLFSTQDRTYKSYAWLSAVIPFILITGTYQVNQYMDILILGILGTKGEVGLYRVAVQAGLVGLVGLQAVQMLSQPYIARFYAQGDKIRLSRLLRACSRGAFLLSLIIFCIFIVVGRQLIELVFGRDYIGCYVPLLILAAGQLVNCFFGVVDVLLEMTGHQKDSARSFVTGAACNILLNILLIPFFGTIGAATATATSTVVWNVLLWRFARKRLNMGTTAVEVRFAR